MKAYGFLFLFVRISGVGGWVSRNPNIVRILKSVGCSLTHFIMLFASIQDMTPYIFYNYGLDPLLTYIRGVVSSDEIESHFKKRPTSFKNI